MSSIVCIGDEEVWGEEGGCCAEGEVVNWGGLGMW